VFVCVFVCVYFGGPLKALCVVQLTAHCRRCEWVWVCVCVCVGVFGWRIEDMVRGITGCLSQVCVRVCVHACVCVCMCVCMYVCAYDMHASCHTCIVKYAAVRTLSQVCVCLCVCVCVRVCV